MAVQAQSAPPAETKSPTGLQRQDPWWISPAVFFVVFTAFAVWATLRAFQNNYFLYQNYLSPFYSPILPIQWHLFGYMVSPALYILVFPLSFRLTCYYYRKSIYRSYIADPAACAVTEPKPLEKARFRRYTGERTFPLIVMNFHRFAFYAAVVFIVILWIDTFNAFFYFPGPGNTTHFGIAVGSLVFLINILLLTGYTFSCHSWRHLIGGGVDCYSCSALNRTRYGLWRQISFLNERHGLWAMLSLCSVGLTDAYVYLISTHAFPDIHLFR